MRRKLDVIQLRSHEKTTTQKLYDNTVCFDFYVTTNARLQQQATTEHLVDAEHQTQPVKGL